MIAEDDIPTLTDLIEKGTADDEIRIADLGLDDAALGFDRTDMNIEDVDLDIDDSGLEIEAFPSRRSDDPFTANPALEQTVRRILDKHMELAWQEIKLAIQLELQKR